MNTVRKHHQTLPAAGPEREALREKGQFWTPDWVAEAMAAYVLANGCEELFDPAVGEGAFFRTAKSLAAETGRQVKLSGTELDSQVLMRARNNGLTDSDLKFVRITDFVLDPPQRLFGAIVANPPYIRHHRLRADYKAKLRKFGASLIGLPLDGRAGLHIYFLLRALRLLATNGRLAFIMPADTCEGVFALRLWRWITTHYCLDAVITFGPEASPFPGVDTNPLIFLIRNTPPSEHFQWVRCQAALSDHLKKWVVSEFAEQLDDVLLVKKRRLSEGLATGLSRPAVEKSSSSPTLGEFARVLRGIATGANEFFFLSTQQASNLGVPTEFLRLAIGRTRDVTGDELTNETLDGLARRRRPTLLFSPDGRPLERFPRPVRDYLERGESMGFPQRPLIASRNPWYRMEIRTPPPILFAYLGRRNARFIRNRAGVIPLTGFLCVYPHEKGEQYVESLWKVLSHPQTIANLPLVGKSYGSGAIKVEPRALERLPLPSLVIEQAGLTISARGAQLSIRYPDSA